jgi:hypothetical protein
MTKAPQKRSQLSSKRSLSFVQIVSLSSRCKIYNYRPVVVVDANPPDPLLSIPSPAMRERSTKLKETPVPMAGSDSSSKSNKNDADITKIREKHAQERAAQR